MTVFKEGPRTAEYLISEANGHLSRETGALAAGIAGELPAGSVLGKVTAPELTSSTIRRLSTAARTLPAFSSRLAALVTFAP